MSRPSVASGADRSWIAASTLISAALVDLLPLPDSSGRWPMPSLLPCVLFYWTLVRPIGITDALLLALGILVDAVSGLPLGCTAMALLVARTVAHALRRVLLDQPPFVVWAGFLVVALAWQATRWVLVSLALGHPFPLRPQLLELIGSLAVYPAVAAMLSMLRPRTRRRASRA
jgi:rod shape-determining protein MreD